MRLFPPSFLLFAVLLSACTRAAPVDPNFTPVVPLVNPNLPTPLPVMTYLPPTRQPGAPIVTPTANQPLVPTFTPLPAGATPQFLPTPTAGPLLYTVEVGDYPASIAEKFGITVNELLSTNNLGADPVIYPGDTLTIPVTNVTQQAPLITPAPQQATADYFKILPDSELVYGPLSSLLNVDAFVQKEGGYLAYYTQEVDGETLTGAQIVVKVAHNYSVNPRLLLAMLEYRAQWVTNPNPAPSTAYVPIGYVDDFHQGLYRQLTWTADMLNQGFYRWEEKKISVWTLADGTEIVPQPGINPGTAAVQHLFSKLDDQATWTIDTGPNGLYATFGALFGYPFDLAIEPLRPAGLTQPTLALPFRSGEVWQFTGGPHAGWDQGSAWAALDFAPPGEPLGCGASDAWVTAVAPGLILRAGNGAVVEDLDGDGLEQTGWTILYMHMESRERVQPGTRVQVGDKIGHPSCEGGLANADHLHLARRYNGLWVPAADPQAPFVMDGYTTTGNDVEYDGWLTRGGTVVEAWDGRNPVNEIQR
jgi:murein DD-endopeptidase MepM/ murein hydrolase activator NlpD